ncbi:hypothetical protein GN958_ATG09867, partial [Phytophthora infestans]
IREALSLIQKLPTRAANAEVKTKLRETTAPFVSGGGVTGLSDSRTHRLVASNASETRPLPGKQPATP